MGLLGIAYALSRTLGKWSGAYLGGVLSQAPTVTKKWLGLAMLPQAGVGIGLALAASKYFPHYQQVLLSVVISSTIFFEFLGPILARLSLRKAKQMA